MDIASIIGILLFIMPGIMAEKISGRMDFPSKDKSSDFKDIINGILLSLPVMLIAGVITFWQYGVKSLTGFKAYIDDFSFIMWFAFYVFSSAICIGLLKGITKDFWISLVNKIRNYYKKLSIDDKSCWRKLFLEDAYNNEEDRTKYPKYIVIELNGKTYEGFALSYSLPNEELEIALETPENMVCYPEFKNYLSSEKIYVNIEKGIIIKCYDTKKLNEYLDNLTNNLNHQIS
ncbi:MAG: hypothetical protein GX957_08545 [Clostridiaceae bacterium]|nr:hypothetical protein [Clostridiaceae bacterium]